MPEHPIVKEGYIPSLETRNAALEAERDIWKERAQGQKRPDIHDNWNAIDMWPDPTPDEIAARVAERKERTP